MGRKGCEALGLVWVLLNCTGAGLEEGHEELHPGQEVWEPHLSITATSTFFNCTWGQGCTQDYLSAKLSSFYVGLAEGCCSEPWDSDAGCLAEVPCFFIAEVLPSNSDTTVMPALTLPSALHCNEYNSCS